MATHSYNLILKSIWEKIGFSRLKHREKVFIGIGVAFIICFSLIQFIISPYLDARKRLNKSLISKRTELAKIIQMQEEYRLLKNQTGATKNRLSERTKGFTLFSFLEEQATIAKVKQQIQYMKPSTLDKDGTELESIVEMKLQRISLGQLVSFLKLVESSENMVFIRHISIQESGTDDGRLDVIFQIITFMNKT